MAGGQHGDAHESAVAQLLSLGRALRASPYRGRLALLTIGIVVVICANAAGQIRLNVWQRAFYDAVEQRHVAAFMTQLGVFAIIAGGLLVLVVARPGCRK
jgi:putative ATP-binding cassette transporter